jgi:subtilisin family serine protease
MRILGAVTAIGLAAVGIAPTTATAATTTATVTVHAATNPVAGSYVVVLKAAPGQVSTSSAKAAAVSVASIAAGSVVTHTYVATINGFSVKTDAEGARKIAADPRVLAVYQDGVARIDTSEVVPPAPNTYWGLDALDQRGATVIDGKYNYSYTGAGVRVYDIDTGIRGTHTQFAGRVLPGATAINDGYGTFDCNGHGTHTAGTIGGTTYGVAKSVKIVPVRVLGCDGSGFLSGVIAGVDWVTSQKLANPAVPMVANMSLGGSWYWPLDMSVHASIESGITYVVSAGNSFSADACNVSPADVLSAITVGATGNWENPNAPASRNKSTYSNTGPCVDVWAPGSNILSAYNTSDTAAAVESGTSMAAPHVAGIAALYLQSRPSANPMEVRNYIVGVSTKNVVGGLDSSTPNRFVWAGAPSVLSVTAPAKVKKNIAFAISGTLTAGGTPLTASSVMVYYQATGSTIKTLKATLATNSAGKFAGSFKETAKGTWTVVYTAVPLIGGSAIAKVVAI